MSIPYDVSRAIIQRERADKMRALTVETCMGNVFQADEDSQNRMARVLLARDEERPDGEVDWILADDSVATVTLLELEEALRLAVEAQQAIWIID